jgi:hypothetical protein
VVPFMLVDFGFEPSAGLYAYWDDAGFKGHDLRFRGSTWGPHWLSGSLKERFELGKLALSLKGKLTKRPDLTFYGIGPDTRESELVRYSARTAYAHVQSSLRFGEHDRLETTAGYRGASFGHSDYDHPSLEEAVRAGKLAEPAGFRDGYRTLFAMTRLLLPTPCGSETELRIIWSACLGSMPRLKITSTDWSNFVGGKSFSASIAWSTGIGFTTGFSAAFLYRLDRRSTT